MSGFLLKKILGLIFMPLSIALIFLLLAGVYLLQKRYRHALAPLVLGTILVYGFSLNSLAGFLIGPLERAYPALDLTEEGISKQPIKWVVVLGSGQWSDADLSPLAILDEAALFRLAEGLRIANHFSQSILLLSGGKFRDTQSSAQAMAMAATSLGFDPSRILLADQALDTRQEAVHIKDLVGQDDFVLVTSASHMLRAMKLFEHQGLKPLPAPAYYRNKKEPELLLPYPGNLHTCHLAIHEYLGLIWAFLRGQISMTSL